MSGRPTRGHFEFQANLDPAPKPPSALPNLASPEHQVAAAGRDARVAALHTDTVLPWDQRNAKAIVQRDGLIQGADLVVTIRTLPKNSQAQIDLGEGGEGNGAATSDE